MEVPKDEICIELDAADGTTTLRAGNAELGRGTWDGRALNRAGERLRESHSRPVRGTGREAGLVRQAGEALFAGLFPGELGPTLDKAIGERIKPRGGTASLAFAVVTPEAASLQVEALVSPTLGVLASDPRLRLFRRAAPALEAADLPPPPLRILFVVASPDIDGRQGRMLDFELEEWVLLQALQPLIAAGRAILEPLEAGSLQAVEEALEAEAFHVLHFTGHGSPGQLQMEGPYGEEAPVSQEELAALLGRFPSLRLVVLSGCATASAAVLERVAAAAEEGDGTGERRAAEGERPGVLQGIAQALSGLGIDFVVGMQASIPDTAATRWAEAFYGHLVRGRGDVAAAFQESRRRLKALEEKEPAETGNWGQWPLPVLYLRAVAPQLFDPHAPPDPSRARPAPASPLYEGIARLGVGRFIGRRPLRRQLAQRLRDSAVGTVLLYGLGGIGKSALGTELAEITRKRAGALVLALRAPITLAALIGQVKLLLNRLLLQPGLPEDFKEFSKAILGQLGEGTGLEPGQQLELVITQLGARLPLLLFLDNFEDELAPAGEGQRTVRDPELARALTLWARQPGPSKLLITCRYPFQLPGLPASRLVQHMVGPLERAEARKLMLRFPALRALPREDLEAIHHRLGGHPRSIEYLAAKLEHGKATWGEVGAELDRHLLERQLEPRALHDADEAVRDTLARAAEDILLQGLLEETDAAAQDLLCRAAVYRQPVGRNGLAKLVGGREVEAEIERLVALTLLYRGEGAEGRRHYLVHRVTAEAILAGVSEAVRTEAHGAAAGYFEYRYQHVNHDLGDLLEARWHWLQCGEIERASEIAFTAEDLLRRWGHWRQAELLNAETWALAGASEEVRAAAAQNLGICHQLRGDYGEALKWFRQALAINEELGNRAGMASSYHHLGWIAQDRGDYDEALKWYRQALAIVEELGNRAGMASSYHHLGLIAHLRGDYEEAQERYSQSLKIEEELDNRAGIAASYHQLGRLAQTRQDCNEALRRYQLALTIQNQLGDLAGIANTYLHLGILAHLREDFNEAQKRLRQALTIFEELGDRHGIAHSYHQLGAVEHSRGDDDEALKWMRQALTILEELGNRGDTANSYGLMAVLLTDLDRVEEAVPLTLRSMMIQMELQIPIDLNIRQLHRQEELLSAEAFRSAVVKVLGEEAAAKLIEDLHSWREAS